MVEERGVFRVEGKHFKISKRGLKEIDLTETARGFEVTIAFTELTTCWMVDHLSRMLSGEIREGFIGKRVEGGTAVILKKWRNKGGSFLAILVISRQLRPGRKYICCPSGAEDIGRRNLRDGLRAVSSKTPQREVGSGQIRREAMAPILRCREKPAFIIMVEMSD